MIVSNSEVVGSVVSADAPPGQVRPVLAPPLRADGTSLDQPTRGWRPLFRRRWFVAIAFVVTMVVAGVISGGLVHLLGGRGDLPFVVGQLVGTVVAYLLVLLLEQRGRLELSARRLVGLPVGLVLGVVLISGCVGLLTLLGLRVFTGVNPSPVVLMPLLQVGLVAGVSEELIFRGIFFRMLEGTLGTWWTALASGLFFGLAHLPNPNATVWSALAIALEAGVMFACLYALTRSLWVVIGVHAAWNVMQGTVYGVSVSGTDANGLLLSQPAGPALLSGGAFGVEASLLTVLLLTSFTVWLARELARRGLVVRPAWATNDSQPA